MFLDVNSILSIDRFIEILNAEALDFLAVQVHFSIEKMLNMIQKYKDTRKESTVISLEKDLQCSDVAFFDLRIYISM